MFNDIKNRIVDLTVRDDVILMLINSCLKKEGTNKKHSRVITLDKKKPFEPAISEEDLFNIQLDLLKYIIKSLQSEKPNYMYNYLIRLNDDQLIDIINHKNINKYDEQIVKIINKIYTRCCNLKEEHNGAITSNNSLPYSVIVPKLGEVNTMPGSGGGIYNKRLYFNPRSYGLSHFQFLSLFIKKCVDERIPFGMKGCGSFSHREYENDGLIIYSTNEYLNKHIQIVESLIDEHPELMQNYATPFIGGGTVFSKTGNIYYSISSGAPMTYIAPDDRGVPKTYNDYMDILINTTYIISCASIITSYYPYFSKEILNNKDFKEFYYLIKDINNMSIKDIYNLNSNSNSKMLRQKIYEFLSNKQINEQNEIKEKMIQVFKTKLKIVASVLKFKDKDHLDCPIYMDQSFINFVNAKEKNETISFK